MTFTTKEVEYTDGGTQFKCLLAYDDEVQKKRPGVMIAPTFAGRNAFVEARARDLVELGYVALGLDLYGNAKVGESVSENRAMMQALVEDRSVVKQRMQLGLDALKAQTQVDGARTAAIGYCMGGLCVLDLARAGAQVNGVVSFHGMLTPPNDGTEADVGAKVLVLHGYDDPMVPPEQVQAFEQEMNHAKADWQLHAYGQTMHAFTNPQANDPNFGTVYNQDANRRSWRSMLNFFDELFD